MAILPFAVLEGANVRAQAELCYGITCFLHRQLSRVAGFETVVHHAATPHDSRTADKGQSVGWSAEALAMSLPEGWEPTHVLRGKARWDDDGLCLEVELLDLQAAMGLFKDRVEGTGTDAVGMLHGLLGALADKLGDSPHAAKLLRRIPTRSPQSFRHYLVGLAAAQNWRRGLTVPERPIAAFLDALKADEDFYTATSDLLDLCEECLAQDDQESKAAGRSGLERAVAMLPREALFGARLGILLAEAGADLPRAAELLHRALQAPLAPVLASRCREAQATLARGAGRAREAIDLLQIAVQLDPDNGRAYAALGDLRQQLGMMAMAEQAWRASLRLDPKQPRLLAALGARHLERREDLLARSLADQALELDADCQLATAVLARCCLRSYEYEEADEIATEWAERHPEAPVAWLALAEARWYRGDQAAGRYALGRAEALCTLNAHRERVALVRLALEHPQENRVIGRIQQLSDDVLRESPDLVTLVREKLRDIEERHGKSLVVKRQLDRLDALHPQREQESEVPPAEVMTSIPKAELLGGEVVSPATSNSPWKQLLSAASRLFRFSDRAK